MALKVEHELHKRRLSRNVGVAVALVLLIAVVFGLTLAKVSSGQSESLQGFDHTVRPQMTEPE